MSTSIPAQPSASSVTGPGSQDSISTSMEATQSGQAASKASPTFASNVQILTPSDSEAADPFDEKPTMTTIPMPVDARSIVRLLQCQQCSLPLRAPVTLPCGHSLCSQYCLPERFKRENISFPMGAARMEGFICPFRDCGQEHSVADCAQDVTLTKVIEHVAMGVADYRMLHDVAPMLLQERLRPWTDEELMQFEAAGVSEPKPSSITLSGGTLAAIYTMAEQGKLRYDSDVSPSPDTTSLANDESLPEPAVTYSDITQSELNDGLYTSLSINARTEVDCQLCWNLLYEPLTTPCGHTFCRSCVARMLDHSTSCPFCRKPLHLPPGVRDVVGNRRLNSILSTFWSAELSARHDMILAERESMKTDIPIFPCTLAFPSMPTFLHIFEPRYRLMMRRVMESETKIFGMVMYNSGRIPQGSDWDQDCMWMRQGTLLRINATAMLPDGRSLIEAVGIGRFSCKTYREMDGYVVGRTERIEDVSLETEERMEADDVSRAPPSTPSQTEAGMPGSIPTPAMPVDQMQELETMPTAELLSISTDFVRRMRAASAPWLNERILQSYGQPPLEDARSFPWWFASVLPIREDEKYALVGMTSVRERVKQCAKWVRRIEAQRWYSVSNCNVA